MTIIVSNGYYLAADQRVTVTDMVHPHISAKTNAPTTTHRFDGMKKINLIDKQVALEGFKDAGYLKAFACSGNSTMTKVFQEILNSSSSIHTDNWMNIFKTSCGTGSTIVAVTSTNKTLVINAKPSKVTVSLFATGIFVTEGSGSNVTHYLKARARRTKATVEEMMALSAVLDNASSHIYSVYGVEENILYATVEPSKEHTVAQAKALWNRVGEDFKISPIN